MPTLLASSVFLNSTSQALNLVKLMAVPRNIRTSAPAALSVCCAAPAHVEMNYMMDIVGPILPDSVVRLMALLQVTQKVKPARGAHSMQRSRGVPLVVSAHV
jgi:hypothetical protein